VCVFLLCCLACSPTSYKDSVPQIVVVNQKLMGYVKSFVEQLTKKHEKQKSITIYLQKAGDTTFITIVNSMPDIELTKINGMLNVNGYHLYFTGVLLENFYKVSPGKVYEVDKNIFDRRTTKLSNIKFSEPLQCDMAFVRDSLINQYSPPSR
jgi:hypothetical protein